MYGGCLLCPLYPLLMEWNHHHELSWIYWSNGTFLTTAVTSLFSFPFSLSLSLSLSLPLPLSLFGTAFSNLQSFNLQGCFWIHHIENVKYRMSPENVTRFVRHSRYEQKSQQLSNKIFFFNHFYFIYHLSANSSLLINDKMRLDHDKRVWSHDPGHSSVSLNRIDYRLYTV